MIFVDRVLITTSSSRSKPPTISSLTTFPPPLCSAYLHWFPSTFDLLTQPVLFVKKSLFSLSMLLLKLLDLCQIIVHYFESIIGLLLFSSRQTLQKLSFICDRLVQIGRQLIKSREVWKHWHVLKLGSSSFCLYLCNFFANLSFLSMYFFEFILEYFALFFDLFLFFSEILTLLSNKFWKTYRAWRLTLVSNSIQVSLACNWGQI